MLHPQRELSGFCHWVKAMQHAPATRKALLTSFNLEKNHHITLLDLQTKHTNCNQEANRNHNLNSFFVA